MTGGGKNARAVRWVRGGHAKKRAPKAFFLLSTIARARALERSPTRGASNTAEVTEFNYLFNILFPREQKYIEASFFYFFFGGPALARTVLAAKIPE